MLPSIEIDVTADNLIGSFDEENPVREIDFLLKKCNCSKRTMNRRMKKNKILVSCNYNSKFYTLPKLAKFNEFGIWDYCGIVFSKNGNLSETIIHHINKSSSGYSSEEFKKVLPIRIYDQLRILTKKNRIKKAVKMQKNIYFSFDKISFRLQEKNREDLITAEFAKRKAKLPSNKDIITILIGIILSEKLDILQICNQLKQKNKKLAIEQVEAVIEHYDLKKTVKYEPSTY